MTAPPPARPIASATLLLLRDGPDGLEVFMIQRHPEADFAAGALVFPGGRVDPGDGDPRLAALCTRRDPPAERRLRVAAIREAFEECGVLLAREARDGPLVDAARARDLLARHRADLVAGRLGMADLAAAEGLVLADDRLVPFSHWITPEFVPRRFDTLFYLAETPEQPEPVHDGEESVDSLWIGPDEAVRDAEAQRRPIIFPTLMNLRQLAESRRTADAFAAARRRRIVPVLPRVEARADGAVMVIPPDAGYGRVEERLDDMVRR